MPQQPHYAQHCISSDALLLVLLVLLVQCSVAYSTSSSSVKTFQQQRTIPVTVLQGSMLSSSSAFPQNCLSGIAPSNHSKCDFADKVLPEQYALQCAMGFYGNRCERACSSNCSSVHCNNDGTCIDYENTSNNNLQKNKRNKNEVEQGTNSAIACHCQANHYGPNCSLTCNQCAKGTWCNMDGTCAGNGNYYLTKYNVTKHCDRLIVKDPWETHSVCRPVVKGYADKTSCLNYTRYYSDWLPDIYIYNVQAACRVTPEEPSANCVRQYLQDRLTQFPVDQIDLLRSLKKQYASGAISRQDYDRALNEPLTQRIYRDHQEAYKQCCCIGTPAPYWSWQLIATVKWTPWMIDSGIRFLGSCHHRGYWFEW